MPPRKGPRLASETKFVYPPPHPTLRVIDFPPFKTGGPGLLDRVQRKAESLGLTIAVSTIPNAGLGLFTLIPRKGPQKATKLRARKIRGGDFIVAYEGKLLLPQQADYNPYQLRRYYDKEPLEERIVDPGNDPFSLARYANTKFKQTIDKNNKEKIVLQTNAQFDPWRPHQGPFPLLVATKDIPAGGEIFADYNSIDYLRDQLINPPEEEEDPEATEDEDEKVYPPPDRSGPQLTDEGRADIDRLMQASSSTPRSILHSSSSSPRPHPPHIRIDTERNEEREVERYLRPEDTFHRVHKRKREEEDLTGEDEEEERLPPLPRQQPPAPKFEPVKREEFLDLSSYDPPKPGGHLHRMIHSPNHRWRALARFVLRHRR